MLDAQAQSRALAAADLLIETVAGRPLGADLGLASGIAGRAVLYCAAARSGLRTAVNEARCRESVDALLDGLEQSPLGVGLFDGLSGVGWALAYCSDVVDVPAEFLEDLDAVLLKHVSERPWRGKLDLVSGIVGNGLYGTRRREHGYALVEQVLECLQELAEPQSPGLAWRREAAHGRKSWAAQFQDGYFDLGVAHGCAGIVAFASGHVRTHDLAEPLYRGGAAWLASQMRPEGDGSLFPATIGSDPHAGGLWAWCYGAPGIVGAVTRAPEALDDSELLVWRRAAEYTASAILRTEILDGGICHGLAGLALIFARLASRFDSVQVVRAANHFRSMLVSLVDRAAHHVVSSDVIDTSLIRGIGGTALALLLLSSRTELASDGWLLLS